MRLTINRKTSLSVMALGVVALLLLTSCGSIKEHKIDAWGFKYERKHDIHDRVYTSNLKGVVGELTYHPDSYLPYFRFGFADGNRLIDTTGHEYPHVVKTYSYFSIPWLMTSVNAVISTPTNMYSITRVQEIKGSESELLCDPTLEAIE